MTTNLRQLFLEHVGQTSDNPMMLEVERAEGIYLYGRDGKRWIDLISGVSVSAVGHGNRQVIDAICSQAQDYLHLMVYGEAVESPQVRYAQRIASLLPDPLDTVYFVNSGSEAVEGALKLAKRYTGRTEIIYYKNAYHGSTHGSLSVMGGEEYRNAYRPLLPDTRQIRFNEPADLRYVTPRTACVIIEPVQGEGGIFPADRDYLQALRDRCDQTGTLLIYDEIQTGLGRTGTLYFFQQYGIVPDILCTAKAFGGGMPLGAFIASNRIMSVLKTNPVLGHITTFGGHPVCCAAGLAALEYILSGRRKRSVVRKPAGRTSARPRNPADGSAAGRRIRRQRTDRADRAAGDRPGADDRMVPVSRHGNADRPAADNHRRGDPRILRDSAGSAERSCRIAFPDAPCRSRDIRGKRAATALRRF